MCEELLAATTQMQTQELLFTNFDPVGLCLIPFPDMFSHRHNAPAEILKCLEFSLGNETCFQF